MKPTKRQNKQDKSHSNNHLSLLGTVRHGIMAVWNVTVFTRKHIIHIDKVGIKLYHIYSIFSSRHSNLFVHFNLSLNFSLHAMVSLIHISWKGSIIREISKFPPKLLYINLKNSKLPAFLKNSKKYGKNGIKIKIDEIPSTFTDEEFLVE